MLISEMITQLVKMKDEIGDVPVLVTKAGDYCMAHMSIIPTRYSLVRKVKSFVDKENDSVIERITTETRMNGCFIGFRSEQDEVVYLNGDPASCET